MLAFDLAIRGGTVGFDADLALWDPQRKTVITQSILHHGADYTSWEGYEATGWPVMTLVRGKVVMRDGEIMDAKGHGTIVSRGHSSLAGLDVTL
jgi:dihydropyrimidinase